MLNKGSQRIGRELFESRAMSEETIYRTMAKDMMRSMPFEDLKKIFTTIKVDPESKEAERIMKNPDISPGLFHLIRDLGLQRHILFELHCDIR